MIWYGVRIDARKNGDIDRCYSIATRCLHGKEVRERFDEEVANLYHDLDNGFTPLAWFLPAWIPFPRYRHIITHL